MVKAWLPNRYGLMNLQAKEPTGFPGPKAQPSNLELKWEVPCYLVMVRLILLIYENLIRS